MAPPIKTKAGLVKAFADQPERIRSHFGHLPTLAKQFPLEVALAYVFAQLELAQNMALYCGAVKLFRANAELARRAVSTHHMTRANFAALYKTVFSADLPKAAADELKRAEAVRDKVMHGKPTKPTELREAIGCVLDYATAMNEQLKGSHKIQPFGRLSGFSGRAAKLDKKTSHFVLKGIGFGQG
jgi:hypothetical protein